MEQLNTSSTMITHSTTLKTDLGSTAAMFASNLSMESPKTDVLFPVNGSELSNQNNELSPTKNFEKSQHVNESDTACILNGKDSGMNDVFSQANMTKEPEIDLDESCKEDVESLIQGNVMDVVFSDHMDANNSKDLTINNSNAKSPVVNNEEIKLDNKNDNDNSSSKKVIADEKSEKTECELNDKALNFSELSESAITHVNNLESDNVAKGSQEASFQEYVNEESKNLGDPFHISENDNLESSGEKGFVEEKNLSDSQVPNSEINSLFSDLEKNFSSQDTYVSDSLLNLSENLINLNSEEINLNCSEKPDSINTENDLDVPEVSSDKLTVIDEIINEVGEKLTDDLVHSSLDQGEESDKVNHSLASTELLVDSIKNPESLTLDNVVNETEGSSKDDFENSKEQTNLIEESGKEKELLQTLEEDKGILTEEIDEEELLKDVTNEILEKSAEAMDVETAADDAMDVDPEDGVNNDVEMHALSKELTKDDASEQNDFSSNEKSENLTETDNKVTEKSDENKTVCENGEESSFAVKDVETDDVSDLVSELDVLFNSPKSVSHHDTIVGKDLPKENNEEDVPEDSKSVSHHDTSNDTIVEEDLPKEKDVPENGDNISHHDTSTDTIVDEDLPKDNIEEGVPENNESDTHLDTSVDTIVDEDLPKEKNLPESNKNVSHHDTSADTIVDEDLPKANNEAEVMSFGMLEATSIPPTEFENMESTATNEAREQTLIPNLSELAQNVLNEANGSKSSKAKIHVKTIKQEILDFSIKEEMIEESYDQMTFQEDIKPNLDLSGVNKNNKNNSKKSKRKQSPFLTTSSKRKRNMLKKLREIGAETSKPDERQKKKKAKKVIPAKSPAIKKTSFPVINLTANKNTSSNKRSRSSLNLTLPSSSTPTASAKKPRLSLPNVKNRLTTRTGGKRLLRSAGEIAEKIQDIVNERPPIKINNKPVKTKTKQVALKSTTQVKLPVARKSTTQVARKRGQPNFRAREPEPIFVDTNFGGQDIDMFINENDDEDSVTYYDERRRYPDYPRSRFSSPRKRLRTCEVVIKRMPIIDKLLPAKKEEKLEPNICESCDPKRIFLSKSSLAEHIKIEHLRNSGDTMVIPLTENPVPPRNEPDEVKACNFCKKTFHSKNRLAEHMKTCKSEMLSKKVRNTIPGIDLSNLNSDTREIPLTKSVTISYAKKNEEKAAPTTNHVCKICNRKFLMATGLKSHMKTHKIGTATPKPQKPGKSSNLSCDICDKNFQYCSDLVEHMSFHSLPSEKEKDILITNLKKISNVKIDVESYVESSDDSESDDNFSYDSSDFCYPIKTESLPKIDFSPNKCHECGRIFTIKTVYDRHIGLISKISNLKPPYTCPICDVEMKYRCRLGAHLETHKPQPEEQLICKKCNKTFRCENNLIRHELEHEGKLKVNCQYCSLSFNSMSDLYSHQGDCKFKSNEYKCNLCKRVFTAKWRLDLHMKIDEKHGTDPQQPNTYFCDQCGREFKHLSVLKRHVDSRCGTEPLYECPDCEKKYFSQGSLASHKRTQHSTEKNFMCQYCSKDFFTKHQLHRHEMRHNPDVRPYRCKYPNCDKTYRQPDSLRAHECEHTGVYPYACEFCGVQFSNVKSLKLHRKSANHWSDVEPNKVVTQACRQKHLPERKERRDRQPSEEDEIDPEGREDEPKNLVVNETQFDGMYGGERVAVPQYSTLQPFTVNHLMHHNQQNPVLVQAPHPLTSYTQAIENYFVIASQQEPLAAAHHHSMMN